MITKEITALHVQIANRYEELCGASADDHITTMMDLEATALVFPDFRWKELAGADEINFLHDVCGIKSHIDRSAAFHGNTHEDELFFDCFVPRYSS